MSRNRNVATHAEEQVECNEADQNPAKRPDAQEEKRNLPVGLYRSYPSQNSEHGPRCTVNRSAERRHFRKQRVQSNRRDGTADSSSTV